jgi:hypothetical protein
MARILFGNMVADARGKLGGIVYSRNTGGAYARQKVSPVQPRTEAQLNQRSRLSETSKLWDTLTQSQREAWKSFSLGFKKRDVFGLAKQRTGQQMFMFCNLALISSGFSAILNPPTDLAVNAITSVGVVNTTNGAVTSVEVTAAGTGYTSLPAVGFTGGGGTGVLATAVLVPTTVASVGTIVAGSGYTSTPTVTFTGGGGSGATATATVVADAITAITLTSPGSGYTSVPTVVVTGGGGTGGGGTAVLTATGVATVTVTAQGTGYTSAPTVAFTGGAGTGATGRSFIDLSTTDLSVTTVPNTPIQPWEAFEIWATPAYNVGKTFVKNLYRYLQIEDFNAISPFDISAAWVNVFGALPTMTPYKIDARVRVINSLNGARSEFAVGTLLQS